MTEYQIAVQRACSKCPIGEPGCRDVCPTFKRAMNAVLKEKGIPKPKKLRQPRSPDGLNPEEQKKLILCREIIREAYNVRAKGGGKYKFAVRKEKPKDT